MNNKSFAYYWSISKISDILSPQVKELVSITYFPLIMISTAQKLNVDDITIGAPYYVSAMSLSARGDTK